MGNSLSCGTSLTKPCLGLTDIRYDPSVSNNLMDQEPIWAKYAGLWGPMKYTYSIADGPDRPPTFYDPVSKTGWPYKSDVFVGFRSVTIEGTRFKSKGIFFYEPASAEFCEQTPPDGKQNAVGDDVCGENGNVAIIEEYGTSTYDKDGSINLLWESQGPSSDVKSGTPMAVSTKSVVDGTAFFTYVDFPPLYTYALTETFLADADGSRNTLIGAGAAVRHESTDNYERFATSTLAPRFDKAGDFISALQQAYDDHNVKTVPSWVVNGEPLPDCFAEPWGACPSEEDWCSKDPSCSKTPYQEPASSLTGGGVALIVVCACVLSAALFFVIYRWLAAKQRNRYKRQFASQMASQIGHRGSISQLSPADLATEFKRVNKDSNGNIQKDDLWEFVSSGKAGDMTRSDFDALFSAMDVNGDGEVSFMEFCGFMSTCGSAGSQGTMRRVSLLAVNDQADEIAKLIDEKKIA